MNYQKRTRAFIQTEKEVKVCSSVSLVLTIKFGDDAEINSGGAIYIEPPMNVPPYFCSGVRWKISDFVIELPSGVKAQIHRKQPAFWIKRRDVIIIHLRKGRIKKGDLVKINILPTSKNRAPYRSLKKAVFGIYYQEQKDKKVLPIKPFPWVQVLPGPMRSLHAVVTPYTGIGDKKIKLSAFDSYGNPTNFAEGELQISDNGKKKVLHLKNSFDKLIIPFKASQTKLTAVKIFHIQKKKECQTNYYQKKRFGPKGYLPYFGEIHAHSGNSDGIGTTDEYYRFAKDYAKLDFSALTDHYAWGKNRERFWRIMCRAVEKWNEPGSFVTILGTELGTGPYGHRNVYYPGIEQVPLEIPSYKPDVLFSHFKGKKVLIIPHHPNVSGPPETWKECDWSYHNDRLQRLVEICQLRGSSETEKVGGIVMQSHGSSVQSALARGYKLGFIAGTDNHQGRPGAAHSGESLDGKSYPHKVVGLTGLFAKNLTRRAIFQALWDRFTFATANIRSLIYLELNGHRMGRIIRSKSISDCNQRLIHAQYLGIDGECNVELIRNGKVIFEERLKGPYVEFSYRDSIPFSRIAMKPKGYLPFVYYYLRVSQGIERVTWSSPIWSCYDKNLTG